MAAEPEVGAVVLYPPEEAGAEVLYPPDEPGTGAAVGADAAGFLIPSFSRMVSKMLMGFPFWILSSYGKVVYSGHLDHQRSLHHPDAVRSGESILHLSSLKTLG
jgi:hypothetical protein